MWTSHSAGSGNSGSMRRLPLDSGGTYVPAAMAAMKAAFRRRRRWTDRATRALKIRRRVVMVAAQGQYIADSAERGTDRRRCTLAR